MMALVSFVYILYLIIKASLGGVITGWTTIVASIYLMGGLLLVSIGIMGIYVGNIFNETKNRPLYAISEILNEERREK